ncbi:MAG: HPr family phosphocarrier protein [Lachnospiraceae bacterium]
MYSIQVIVSGIDKAYKNPLAELVQRACECSSKIILENGSKEINAKSIMGVLAFQPTEGMHVNIKAIGSDEEADAKKIAKFLCCQL